MVAESLVISFAFCASLAALYRPLKNFTAKTLDSHRQNISNMILVNTESKERYNELLKEVTARYDNLDREVEKILSSARDKAHLLEESAKKKIQEEMNDKLHALEESLLIRNAQFVVDIRRQSVEIASRAVREFINNSISSDNDQREILDSIFKNSRLSKHKHSLEI